MNAGEVFSDNIVYCKYLYKYASQTDVVILTLMSFSLVLNVSFFLFFLLMIPSYFQSIHDFSRF